MKPLFPTWRFLRSILGAAIIFLAAGCVSHHDYITKLPPPVPTCVDYTINEPSVCEIHHIAMIRTNVPIVYGLPVFTPAYSARYAASTNFFPNAETSACGGCVVESLKYATIHVCPECLKAAQKWDADHPAPK